MFGKSFKSKIIIPSVGILVVLTVAMTIIVTQAFLDYTDTLIDEKIEANAKSLQRHFDDCQGHSKAAAVSVMHNPEAIEAIKSRDKEKILRVFTEMLELFQITYFTITDEKGIVLARTYEPERPGGDSITNQMNIQDAMKGKIATYFEAGTVVKVSVRTGVPIRDADGTLIGIVSAGVRFDLDKAVDELKELLQSDVTVFFRETIDSKPVLTRRATTITGKDKKRIVGTPMEDVRVAKALLEDKKTYFGDAIIQDTDYRTFYMPLFDGKNDVFAAVFLGTRMSLLKERSNELVWNVVMIAFMGLAVAIAIQYVVISSISRPLVALTKDMDRIEEGSLGVVVEAYSGDEIGHAGKALQKVVDTIHRLIDDINTTISEHEKGNTDYHLDTDVFRGAYRMLADRIVELSSLGMRDQLTGLPNRRSFDRRLDSEWNRAIRERKPLSILMMDVDKFKVYNDTYGHQQGDVVLQVVAKTVPIPIRRVIDFAARWGGEEFVVLLPHTDSSGAVHVAEMIRSGVEHAEIPSIDGGQAKKVTISIGVNTVIPTPDGTIADLISQADGALYRAKETGRNRVCRHEDVG